MPIWVAFGNILQLFRNEFRTLGVRQDHIVVVAARDHVPNQREKDMSARAVIRMPGEGKEVRLAGKPLTFLVTGENTKHTSMFDWTLSPGFSTGLHIHRVQEETFFVLEGECEWHIDGQKITATPGTYVFLPPGVPHNIANASDRPARMIMTVSPPGHEHYFEELVKLVAQGSPPDANAIAALRDRYDTKQISELKK